MLTQASGVERAVGGSLKTNITKRLWRGLGTDECYILLLYSGNDSFLQTLLIIILGYLYCSCLPDTVPVPAVTCTLGSNHYNLANGMESGPNLVNYSTSTNFIQKLITILHMVRNH